MLATTVPNPKGSFPEMTDPLRWLDTCGATMDLQLAPIFPFDALGPNAEKARALLCNPGNAVTAMRAWSTGVKLNRPNLSHGTIL